MDTEITLTERVAALEKKLEQVLLLLADVYRYQKLQTYLAAGEWENADLETTRVMLEVAGHSTHDTLTPEDLQKLPCTAIQVIDQLWRKYSGERFGFSLQLQIYLSVGGNLDTLRALNIETLQRLGGEIGRYEQKNWIQSEAANFSLSAPVGHLPGNWWYSPYGMKMANYFFMRLISCEIDQ